MNEIRLGAVLIMCGSLLLKEESKSIIASSSDDSGNTDQKETNSIGILQKVDKKKQKRNVGTFEDEKEDLVVPESSIFSSINESEITISASALGKKSAEEYLVRAAENLRDAGIKEFFCLIDSQTAFLQTCLKKLKIQYFFVNHDDDDEKLSSIRSALRIVSTCWSHCMVYPANLPYVRSHTIKAIRNAISSSKKPIIQPCFNQNSGAPFIISEDTYSTIMIRDSNLGINGILDCFVNELVDIPDSGIVRPIYTVDQYEKYVQRERRGARPQPADCGSIWEYCGTSDTIRPHLHLVGEIAYQIANKLGEKGIDVDPELAHVGGLLHGIGKGLLDSEAVGAQWAHDLGYRAVSPIIASSRDLPHDAYEKLDERAIVFWADKIVRHNKLCTIDERYFRSLEQAADNPDRVLQILQRREMARDVQTKILEILDISSQYQEESNDEQVANNMWDEILSSGSGSLRASGLDNDTIRLLRINPEYVEETEEIQEYFSETNEELEFMIVNNTVDEDEWEKIEEIEDLAVEEDNEAIAFKPIPKRPAPNRPAYYEDEEMEIIQKPSFVYQTSEDEKNVDVDADIFDESKEMHNDKPKFGVDIDENNPRFGERLL